MLWFEELVGFAELSPLQVRQNLHVVANRLFSKKNSSSFQCGTLSTPSLAQLRLRTASLSHAAALNSVQELVADVRDLHLDPRFNDAVFQVASQFNLLEMGRPTVTPEAGVGIYQLDRTQGPACAVACGAGTIFRNYFVPLDGRLGQDVHHQIDCLSDLGDELGNCKESLWQMRNGYVFATVSGLRCIRDRLARSSEQERDELRGLLRIGVQQDTQVTLEQSTNLVTQVFCSALPVAYSEHPSSLWEPFARLVLEAAYESTLRVALLNRERTGCGLVFLTLLGGGVFGNRMEWIVDAMERAIALAQNSGLQIRIVSYDRPCVEIRRLLTV